MLVCLGFQHSLDVSEQHSLSALRVQTTSFGLLLRKEKKSRLQRSGKANHTRKKLFMPSPIFLPNMTHEAVQIRRQTGKHT